MSSALSLSNEATTDAASASTVCGRMGNFEMDYSSFVDVLIRRGLDLAPFAWARIAVAEAG